VFDLIRSFRHDAAAVLCGLLELDGEDLRPLSVRVHNCHLLPVCPSASASSRRSR
jgi:hypothetical protein